MTDAITNVVGERADGEGEFVGGVRIAKKALDEVAGADVVDEIREQAAAERVVPEILDERTAVGVGAGLAQRVGGGAGEPLLQDRRNLVVPHHVDDRFVGQDRIGRGVRRRHQDAQQ